MNALTLDQTLELARTRGEHLVSLYLPTRRFSPGSQEEDTTRLRNLLRDAEAQLAGRGMRAPEVDTLLAPARALIDDKGFWLRSQDGLAVLIAPDATVAYQLPGTVAEQVRVSDRFYLRPLLPYVGADERFWLLVLSQKHVRLFEGSRAGLAEVPAEDVPQSLAEAMRYDDFEKESLQFHTNQPGIGGQAAAVFHGSGEIEKKEEILRFFNEVDHGVIEHLKESNAPLILAGVDYTLPIYRAVSTYPYLADEAIVGSVDWVGPAELHARAWAIMESRIEGQRKRLAEDVRNALSSPRLTADPETIVSAAHHGRISTLLLTDVSRWWGRYDEGTTKVVFHKAESPGDEELLDAAALRTLENGGAVVSMAPEEMPHQEAAMALLRY